MISVHNVHTLLQALLFRGTRKDKQQLANEMCAFFIRKIANIRADTNSYLLWVVKQPPHFENKRSFSEFKVAQTYLYARWLCFLITFFGRNDLTDFHDFWHP